MYLTFSEGSNSELTFLDTPGPVWMGICTPTMEAPPSLGCLLLLWANLCCQCHFPEGLHTPCPSVLSRVQMFPLSTENPNPLLNPTKLLASLSSCGNSLHRLIMHLCKYLFSLMAFILLPFALITGPLVLVLRERLSGSARFTFCVCNSLVGYLHRVPSLWPLPALNPPRVLILPSHRSHSSHLP